MIAYFALLSFVPLLFLALSLTALAGQQTESSYLVEELRRAFPASSVDRLLSVVRSIQDQATSIGIIGGIALLWGALGFFSVLESAFNIVYGLPNRSFVRQKLLVLVLVAGSLAVLFIALVVGSLGVELVQSAGVAGGFLSYVYALAVSTARRRSRAVVVVGFGARPDITSTKRLARICPTSSRPISLAPPAAVCASSPSTISSGSGGVAPTRQNSALPPTASTSSGSRKKDRHSSPQT